MGNSAQLGCGRCAARLWNTLLLVLRQSLLSETSLKTPIVILFFIRTGFTCDIFSTLGQSVNKMFKALSKSTKGGVFLSNEVRNIFREASPA